MCVGRGVSKAEAGRGKTKRILGGAPKAIQRLDVFVDRAGRYALTSARHPALNKQLVLATARRPMLLHRVKGTRRDGRCVMK